MSEILNFYTLQHFADQFGLVYMVVLFSGIVLFLLRPKAKVHAKQAASIPLRDDAPRS
ncbi:MAG: cbb3-type cytochrome c oxidase subunit 3 [Devosia nanyangense]|uniref:Cbb3-type cytochrome c oxidase subunit 3 n=1 Tax=Devosia nanyangense TaxID=1228055 RepID=A0A933L5G7_9HYPH|nr:cbb3-type cytochrome c oxidase subunit 3 [Devosia nanyangense]